MTNHNPWPTLHGRRTVLYTAACAIALSYSAFAQIRPALAPNPAAVPADRLSELWWADRHQSIVEKVRARPDVQLLLVGGSIINNFDKANPPDEDFQQVWKEFYEPRRALNLGFAGDTVPHVLWRLRNGEVDGLRPRVAVVVLGTDDALPPGYTELQAEVAMDAVVDELERRLPETRILLLAIPPGDVSPARTDRDQAINRYLAACYGEHPRVTYLDARSAFHRQDTLRAAGQRVLAEAIEPTLAKLLGEPPRLPLASMTDINTAVVPVSALEIDSYDWFARHHAELAAQKMLRPSVVLIGDSITHFWAGPPAAHLVNGPAAWDRVFGKMPVLNMGFGWDRTQNVLWRIQQGEFEGLHPKWIVVAIGTNNLTGTRNARANTPLEIVEGIGVLCRELLRRSPASRIVLMGVFPRGASAGDRFRRGIRDLGGRADPGRNQAIVPRTREISSPRPVGGRCRPQ